MLAYCCMQGASLRLPVTDIPLNPLNVVANMKLSLSVHELQVFTDSKKKPVTAFQHYNCYVPTFTFLESLACPPQAVSCLVSVLSMLSDPSMADTMDYKFVKTVIVIVLDFVTVLHVRMLLFACCVYSF